MLQTGYRAKRTLDLKHGDIIYWRGREFKIAIITVSATTGLMFHKSWLKK